MSGSLSPHSEDHKKQRIREGDIIITVRFSLLLFYFCFSFFVLFCGTNEMSTSLQGDRYKMFGQSGTEESQPDMPRQ